MKNIELIKPSAEHGMPVNQLVASCPPLDTNSVYCNLLQADHFSETSVSAMLEDRLVGFISGYLIPNRTDTLFVWQVAVGEAARGRGLAKKMLSSVLERPACSDVAYIETTITQSNEASWALFRSIAKQLDAPLEDTVQYDKDSHFQGKHDTEFLVRIGPFQ
ncbi:L-2,4-diaminobutyric acid acetyltransferase [Marinomonas spartinae]|uniref:L-2,4-diaminobutyric acid acetyltransferase n=1 Tax=Marinomonas spartinae TaxID=1792290 RepID=A0A1A8TAA8_9GAMM|nr:L-2,4-diaminobutyric acid acetyltransferase [Marinomonas spartinae]SBS28409.1 L-2,4-diaminobutyric acid acetyltransferase [Marinomonas spartinae]